MKCLVLYWVAVGAVVVTVVVAVVVSVVAAVVAGFVDTTVVADLALARCPRGSRLLRLTVCVTRSVPVLWLSF